ncbi:MAG: DUF3108 domain-containing protein [Gammaproteobacteria bacterium]|nr:DUF3108 domain-containing protein [Gammaproteobacteria bacterium]
MKAFSKLIPLVISAASWLPFGFAQELPLYQAEYLAKAAGLSATAERKLELLGDNRYRLSQALEVRVLGARLGEIEETSHFHYIDGILTPEKYRYEQSGVARKKEQVLFDWDSEIARSEEDGEQWLLTISPGVVDKLSFQLLLRRALAEEEIGELTIQMVDADEIESHLYRVTGSEMVKTELGLLDCLRVERIRDSGSERRTTFWLAKDWNFLLAKFEQRSGSDTETELLLEKAIVSGHEVTPLP